VTKPKATLSPPVGGGAAEYVERRAESLSGVPLSEGKRLRHGVEVQHDIESFDGVVRGGGFWGAPA